VSASGYCSDLKRFGALPLLIVAACGGRAARRAFPPD